MNAPLYSLEVLRLAASLPIAEELTQVDGIGDKRSPTCGSRIVTSVQLEGGRVGRLSQQVSACAFGQASAALLAQAATGRSASELHAGRDEVAGWLSGDRSELTQWTGFQVLEPARSKRGRHGAILLPFDALIAALERGGQ